MPFPKAIITKPFLVTDADLKDLGQNINLVGYDTFGKSIENTNQYASPRLVNWVEPYEISGFKKTLFYTEVNSNLMVGDKVFIINGAYDSNSLIKKDKYKKGRDGYNVLKVENCKIVLDIDYTGILPYKDDSLDDYIKVYYIENKESFLHANRQVTTRGGVFDYKFNYGQNNVAFVDSNYGEMDGWGFNGGIIGAPGFFVRNKKDVWSNISDDLVYLGSFSVALSETYANNGKILIQDGDFVYKGIQFKEGFAYKWEAGPTGSSWVVDVEYSKPIITKANFRNGTFNGKFNNGLYGTQESKIEWSGAGTWNGGTMLNSVWRSGTMDSKIDVVKTYKTSLDEKGNPFQKSYVDNNGGFGFNYIIDSEVESSAVSNGNFHNTKFRQSSATFSVVENHVLSINQGFGNNITKAYFDFCEFKGIEIKGGEIRNTRAMNTKFSNVKLVNSYIKNSVVKDSTYIGDGVIKILGYDEWNMSEYMNLASGTYSSIKDVNQKIYKFYISKESYKRFKSEDVFYIKGLKINDGTKKLLNFFDSKFRLTSWTEFYDDYATDSKSATGVDPYSFHKRGYECSAFLSTPEENSHIINSYETEYWYKSPNELTGSTHSKYSTTLAGKNANSGYSIDIIVARHDIVNKNMPMDKNSEWESLNPKDYNYGSDVLPGTSSVPAYLGNMIDISGAYILDADFESGIIETSDWNSGHHINYNNDVVITPVSTDGRYDLEIDSNNGLLIANTLGLMDNPERIGVDVLPKGDIVFLNSVDYDTTGMVAKVSVMKTGSSYSTSFDNRLVNTSISSTTMSSHGTNYITGNDLKTISVGSGTGVTVDIVAKPIGSVLGITYSAPISGGGSYSMTFITSSYPGPIATSFSTDGAILPPSYVTTIVTDIDGSATGVVGATYSVFGPNQTSIATGATAVGVIFATGPNFTGGGMTVDYTTSANGSITNLYINDHGVGYLPGQIFRVEGGNATFSIASVGNGEIISYAIKSKGEDYIKGDVLEILKPFDVNSPYNNGTTASITVTSITASFFDEKGLTLDIVAGSGPNEGKIADIEIKNPGLYYKEGEIFTISGGNLDAIVKIESVTGSLTRLGDTYKVVENKSGVVSLQEVGTQSSFSGMGGGGVFYTSGAGNRWGYISKSKFERTKIKSGLLRRAYITKSLISDINYDSADKDFLNYDRIKNLLITDALFSNNSNILSSATYLYSNMVGGSDIWNDGIIFKSALNGMTFSKGTVKQSIWVDGDFTGGVFYDSRSFDAKPTDIKPNYLSNRARSYFFTGALGSGIFNSRYSWQKGRFSGGEFYKSDWESGIFDNGLFYYSKFYSGTFNNGVVGTKDVSTSDTKIYNAKINYAIVNNAYVYSDDPSYTGMSSSSIEWMDGVFNNGIFGSNNEDVIGTTVSNISYPGLFSTLPIKDFKIASYTQSVTNNDIILNDLEITGKISLKHTYIGDLIINLMAPNGKIVNLKKRYSGGSSDNLIETNFTSDLTKPSLEISTSPHTGDFAFANALNHGVYYKMDGTLLQNVEYQESLRSIPQVLDYGSFPPTNTYEGDRYLVIATSSDPKWTPNSPTTWSDFAYVDTIVEKKYNGTWLPSTAANRNGDYLYIKNRNEYLKYITTSVVSFGNRRSVTTRVNTWVKSYHSNTTDPSALMNADKTITGIWTLLVMDVAGGDVGFVDDFTLNFNYKNNYIIKSFKNEAVWKNGIFNGGQFIDLGIWKNGKFNGGKFISTYGHSKSGNYLVSNKNQDDYSWQAGEFNGGEFGNESSLRNSTWFNGEFNDGVFKGKIWNNGVFLYGEFKGGSTIPVLGGDSKGSAASAFVEQFRNGYYGVWRNGVVSDKKDSFITDKKLFTTPVRAVSPIASNKKAVFTNMLWLGGIFNHPSGEMKNSAWLDGLFQMGRFESSSFNPYVKRYSDNLEFLKDDSCIWENGKLVGSEFFFSKWNYGHFISGTASGMIWKDGIADYMNAYNVFWEKGVWRNGNWNGSSFEYSGQVLDGFVKEILNRGIEWSGTNSCHIWNLFETDVDKTNRMVVSNISDTFATDNQEDAGNGTPKLGATPSYVMHSTQPNAVLITYQILSDGGARITQTGIVYSVDDPGINLSGGQINLVGVSQKSVFPTSLTNKVISSSTYPKGMTVSNILVSNLTPGTTYRGLGYAVNAEGKSYTTGILEFQYVVKNIVSYLSPTSNQTGELMAIDVEGKYSTDNSGYSKPLAKGILYSYANQDPLYGDSDVVIVLDNSDTGPEIKATIPLSGLLPATDYYIRAYAYNKAGYGYSDVQKITTGVIDPRVSAMAPTLDTLLGSVTYMGGSTSLRRGFIIWLSDRPDLVPDISRHPDSYVPYASGSAGGYYRINAADGGIGTFVALIDGLAPTTYYKAKAFAYNPGVNGVFAWDLTPLASIPQFMSPATVPTVGDVSVSIAPLARIMMLTTGKIGNTFSGNFGNYGDSLSQIYSIGKRESFFAQNRDNPLLMQLELNADLTSIGGTPITETGIVYTDGSYWDVEPFVSQGAPAGTYKRVFIFGTASSVAQQLSQNNFKYLDPTITFGTYPGTTVSRPMVPWAPYATSTSNYSKLSNTINPESLSLAYSDKPYIWNADGSIQYSGWSLAATNIGGFVNFDSPFFDLNNRTAYLNTSSEMPEEVNADTYSRGYLRSDISYAGRMIASENKNSWAYKWKTFNYGHDYDTVPGAYIYTAETAGGMVIGTAAYSGQQPHQFVSPIPGTFLGGSSRILEVTRDGGQPFYYRSYKGYGLDTIQYLSRNGGSYIRSLWRFENEIKLLPLPPTGPGKITYGFKRWYPFASETADYYSGVGAQERVAIIKPGLYVEPSQANKLLPGKNYYAKAYAKNKIGIGISEKATMFTTLPLIVDPKISFSISGITQSFTASFGIYSYGATISSFGIIWTDAEDPSTLSWWPTYTGQNPTLPPSTNSTTETFGYYDYSKPQLINKEYNNSQYSYQINDNYNYTLASPIGRFRYDSSYYNGYYYNGLNSGYPFEEKNINLSKSAGNGAGSARIAGNTRLKILVYAKNEGGIAYGMPSVVYSNFLENPLARFDGIDFIAGTVSPAPNLTLVDVTLPGVASSSGEIVHPGVFGNGTQSIMEKGIYYSTTDPLVPVSTSTKVVCTSTGATDMNAITYTSATASARGGFTVAIPDTLAAGRTHYFKTYWKNSTGTAYGPIGSFTSGPGITGTIGFSNNSINVSGISITNTNSTIVEYGVVWKTSFANEYTTQIPIATNPTDFPTGSSRKAGWSGSENISGTRSNISNPISTVGSFYIYARLYIRYYQNNTITWGYSSEQKILSVGRAPNYDRIKVKRSYWGRSSATDTWTGFTGACSDTVGGYYGTDMLVAMSDGLSIRVGDRVYENNLSLFDGNSQYYKIALDDSDPKYEPLNLSCGTKATIVRINDSGVIMEITCCP